MDIRNNRYSSIELMAGQLLNSNVKSSSTSQQPDSTVSFKDILANQKASVSKETQELKFSKHANQRLESRNIDLSKELLKRLESGTRMAQQKGIKESLVMIDNLAFIVNVENNTVVTAVNESESKVFTNIDGAVIA
jgi:flagellar operon protein